MINGVSLAKRVPFKTAWHERHVFPSPLVRLTDDKEGQQRSQQVANICHEVWQTGRHTIS